MNLIGRTFTYRSHGREIIRKVLGIIRGEGEPLYKLLDPVAKTRHQAYVSMFNRMFKTSGGKIKKERFKGERIGGAKQLQNL